MQALRNLDSKFEIGYSQALPCGAVPLSADVKNLKDVLSLSHFVYARRVNDGLRAADSVCNRFVQQSPMQ